MKANVLFLLSLVGAGPGVASTASAQAADLISSIAGDSSFQSDAQSRYFNRKHCGLADDVAIEIRLSQTNPVTDVFLWVSAQNGGCEQVTNRDATLGICAEVPGNPRVVRTNFLVGDLTLQNLLDARAGSADIVSCETSGLTGTPYELFVFRDQAPGSGNVDPSAYGIASFLVDVQPPNAPLVNTAPQEAATFSITWGEPDPPDLVQTWSLWFSRFNDPSTASPTGITASLNERSVSVGAGTLGLADGETGYVFMSVFDQAFVSDDLSGGNESEISDSVAVTSTAVVGFCDIDDACGGCSISKGNLASGSAPSPVAWFLGLLLIVACLRGLRR